MMLIIKGLAVIGTAAGLYKLGGLVWDGHPAIRLDQRVTNFRNGLGFTRDDEASLKTGKLHKVRSRNPNQEA